MNIRFDAININVMSNCSGVFSGLNNQQLWRVNDKTNIGFGRIVGEMNNSVNTINVILDNDILDFSGNGKTSKGQQEITKGDRHMPI